MFFIEKTASDAPEKLQISINTNKPASRERFISKAIKPVTGRKCFQCALKCDRLLTVMGFRGFARVRAEQNEKKKCVFTQTKESLHATFTSESDADQLL